MGKKPCVTPKQLTESRSDIRKGKTIRGPSSIVCLECGQLCGRLDHHILRSHHLSRAVYRRKFGYSDTDPLVSKDFAAKRQAQWEKMRTPRRRAMAFKKDSEHFWHEVDRLAKLLEEWGLTRSDKTEREIKQSLEKL